MIMKFYRFFPRTLAAFVVAVSLLTSPASAHKGHKDDMSDAEMAQGNAQDRAAPNNETAADAAVPQSGEQTPPAVDNVSNQPTAQQVLQEKIDENRVTSVGDFLGRIHPFAVHFPIALFITAALAEFALMLRPSLGLVTSVRLLIAGGAIGAVVAALLGWFAAGWRIHDRSETLGIHRWNGTAIAVVALVAAWLAFRQGGRAPLRICLAVLAAALLFQGYLGGEMVFGINHLGIR